jgi:hypothetical protein
MIHSIRIANKWCNLTPYIPFGTTTQCTNCQGFGHAKAFCKAEPICAVCAGKHMTQKHECPAQTCKGGYRCIHTTLKYTNCGDQHWASNWNCPAKIQVSQEFQEVIRARNEGHEYVVIVITILEFLEFLDVEIKDCMGEYLCTVLRHLYRRVFLIGMNDV